MPHQACCLQQSQNISANQSAPVSQPKTPPVCLLQVLSCCPQSEAPQAALQCRDKPRFQIFRRRQICRDNSRVQVLPFHRQSRNMF